MSDTRQARHALLTRILDAEGQASRAQRRAAFENVGLSEPLSTLVHKAATQAHQITDDDVAALRPSLSEDQIFEVMVCAAVGQATRQCDSALVALDSATERDGDAPRDPR